MYGAHFGRWRHALSGVLLACFSAALAVSTGCVSTRLFQKPASLGDEPWIIAPEAFPSQRLYRVKYKGPEGEAGFKLVLYLEQDTRYRMLATDLGRKLWSLEVDAQNQAIWIDYRRKEYCRASAAGELLFVPLADLPLGAMSKLLLGLIPAEPAASLQRSEDRISFLDARGQLWNGGLVGGRLDWWSLVEAGEVVIWWRREENGGLFVDREGVQEVRWTEIVREALVNPLTELAPPPKFRPGACASATSR